MGKLITRAMAVGVEVVAGGGGRPARSGVVASGVRNALARTGFERAADGFGAQLALELQVRKAAALQGTGRRLGAMVEEHALAVSTRARTPKEVLTGKKVPLPRQIASLEKSLRATIDPVEQRHIAAKLVALEKQLAVREAQLPGLRATHAALQDATQLVLADVDVGAQLTREARDVNRAAELLHGLQTGHTGSGGTVEALAGLHQDTRNTLGKIEAAAQVQVLGSTAPTTELGAALERHTGDALDNVVARVLGETQSLSSGAPLRALPR